MDAKQGLLDLFGAPSDEHPARTTLRRIVTTDVTVSQLLEGSSKEPIRLVKLAERFTTADADAPDLDLPSSAVILRRTELFQGAVSGESFAYADSVVTPGGLDPDVVDRLVGSDQPVGRVLGHYLVDAFREVQSVGFERAGTCATHFGVAPDSMVLVRRCRIHAQGRPVMRSTQKFPIGHF
ncbi:MAG TPA: chorismate pyruvate-lyase family protein [Acidimicrobiales bacterium]|nr:chorismate pyruvate-lyase family protein [Acidimicrobiales bacterium]